MAAGEELSFGIEKAAGNRSEKNGISSMLSCDGNHAFQIFLECGVGVRVAEGVFLLLVIVGKLNEDQVALVNIRIRCRESPLFYEGLRGAAVDGEAAKKDIILEVEEKPLGKAGLGICGNFVEGDGAVTQPYYSLHKNTP